MRVYYLIALALFVPIAWGVLSAWFFDFVRAKRTTGQNESSEIDG